MRSIQAWWFQIESDRMRDFDQDIFSYGACVFKPLGLKEEDRNSVFLLTKGCLIQSLFKSGAISLFYLIFHSSSP